MAASVSRGYNCLNLKNGQCGFAGGRCIDGSVRAGVPYKCPFYKSRAKSTAARVRWARKRRGKGSIGRF